MADSGVAICAFSIATRVRSSTTGNVTVKTTGVFRPATT